MKYLPLLIAILLLASCKCKKDDSIETDYFTFGIAHGECMGDCARFYKIENGKLYADQSDNYYGAPVTYNAHALSPAQYSRAYPLIDSFPAYLNANPNITLGCPDCYDQGGVHIERRRQGVIQYWHIDTDITDTLPEVYKYIQQVDAVIDSL